MSITLHEIARALHGERQGQQVLAPGPGHSRKDRSLSIRLSETSPDGFVVFSHSGDDFRRCRDHVAAALGLDRHRWRSEPEPDLAEQERRAEARRRVEAQERAESLRRQRFANAMWNEAAHPAGTIVETYLRSRGLDLPADVAGSALRYHPRCPWGTGTAPAMVAAIRCITTDAIVGVHRTALTADGAKLGRKVFGSATAAAIKLDGEHVITAGLSVGEGIETCLAGRQMGFGPVWSLISAGNIAALPVFDGVNELTLFAERDTSHASEKACARVGERWHAAGRAVDLIWPPEGCKDLNDALQRGVKECV